MGSYFSIPYVPKRAAAVEVSTVKSETPAPTLVAADLKTEAEPKVRIPLTDMETAITKEVDQLLGQKREPDENKKAIQGLLVMVEDMQKIMEPKAVEKVEETMEKVEPKVEKEEPKVEKVVEKVEEKVEEVEKVEEMEEKAEEMVEKVEEKMEKVEKKAEYKEALKDLLREAHIPKEPALPVIMEEPVVERKLSIIIPSSSPTNPPMPEMNKKKKKK